MNQNVKLEEVWAVEQEILDEFHRVCTENGLRYSLAYGTLLGAVRHQGFIPWDDDIDVVMPREDYDQLRLIWNDIAHKSYILETEESSADGFNNFAKIRKDHTTFLQFESERNRKIHKGIFIDIFPMDRRAQGFSGRIQYALFACNLLYNRGYESGKGGFKHFAEITLLNLVPKKDYHKLSLWFGEKSRFWNDDNTLPFVAPCTILSCFRCYSPTLFEHLELMEFHGKKYYVTKEWDSFLRVRYGDYLTLPPVEERVWTHRPILVDFEHNYEELGL